jgi:hypothetical protein
MAFSSPSLFNAQKPNQTACFFPDSFIKADFS